MLLLQLLKKKLKKTENTFSIQYLFQYIQLQVQLAEHHISSPERELQVRWLQILNILVYIAHQEWCDIRLQHLDPVLNKHQRLNKTLQCNPVPFVCPSIYVFNFLSPLCHIIYKTLLLLKP